MRILLGIMAAAGLAAICIQEAHADWAIAAGQWNGMLGVGTATDAPDIPSAAIAALTSCSEKVLHCHIRSQGSGNCGAWAKTTVGNGAGFGTGDSKEDAGEEALSQCREGNARMRCRVRKTICDAPAAVRPNQSAAEPDTVPPVPTRSEDPTGFYEGSGEGQLTMAITPLGTTGRYSIKIEVGPPSRCSGSFNGVAHAVAGGFTAQSTEPVDGHVCRLMLTPSGDGVSVEEQDGCSTYRGAACAFQGQLSRR